MTNSRIQQIRNELYKLYEKANKAKTTVQYYQLLSASIQDYVAGLDTDSQLVARSYASELLN
jgi:hypothetical protein